MYVLYASVTMALIRRLVKTDGDKSKLEVLQQQQARFWLEDPYPGCIQQSQEYALHPHPHKAISQDLIFGFCCSIAIGVDMLRDEPCARSDRRISCQAGPEFVGRLRTPLWANNYLKASLQRVNHGIQVCHFMRPKHPKRELDTTCNCNGILDRPSSLGMGLRTTVKIRTSPAAGFVLRPILNTWSAKISVK